MSPETVSVFRLSPDCLHRHGIIKCNVLTPRKLCHPVLPYKCNTKVISTLCSACASALNLGNCTHSDEERCKLGAWIVDEFRKAVGIGYSLVDMFEFWEYCLTCLTKVPIQVIFLQNTLPFSWNSNKNNLATLPRFKMRKTKTGTFRTTGAHNELL
jgi:hypothetical protein